MSEKRTDIRDDDPVVKSNAVPAGTVDMSRRQKFRLVGLVILKRVRFIAVLAGVGCSSATGTR